jgi:Na+-transporting NADH:ubiquinone oxidoreductase subunit NqrC
MNIAIVLFDFFADDRFAPIAGAGLGACFYILMKLQPYLENRSFDPKYNSAYITRFVIGMVAGVILANVSAYIFHPVQNPQTITDSIKSFSPAVVGILGGFSSEAVQQILQRLVEVLLSLVRGDNSAQVEAKLNSQQSAKFINVRDKLDGLEKAKSDPDKFQKEMDAVKAVLKQGAC